MTSNEMDKVFRKAASKALLDWEDNDGLEDLVQDLWVWYLERPKTQQKMDQLTFGHKVSWAKSAALQILSEWALASDTFQDRVLYSSDSIRQALEGASTNVYLMDVLPTAWAALDDRNPDQAEAIRVRYTDGVVPEEPGKSVLKRAVKSLTDEVNVTYLTSDNEGKPGSRYVVFPETRGTKGGYSDPTGELAVLFLESPELQDDYFEETDEMWKVIDVQLV